MARKRDEPPIPARAVFRRMRKILDDPTHWGKGDNVVSPGQYCLLGACHVALGRSEDELMEAPILPWQYGHVLHDCIVRLYPSHPERYGISLFNDAPDIKHADILKVLDCAIECS